MNLEKEVQNQEDGKAKTIRETWTEDFLSKIDRRNWMDTFRNPMCRILDEYQAEGGNGVYNTAKNLISRKSLAHLNVPAKPGDEYPPARMLEVVKAYENYHQIMSVLDTIKLDTVVRCNVFDSIPFFAFLVRDSLTRESDRIILDAPVSAALKLAFSPSELAKRLGGKEVWRVEDGISYIRKRMSARVRSGLIEWCQKVSPDEAARWGLPMEARKAALHEEGKVELVYGLRGISLDMLGLDADDLEDIREIIVEADNFINDGLVFSLADSDDLFYVLYEAEGGRFYQQPFRILLGAYGSYFPTEGLVLVEDNDMLTAILDTGVSPIPLTEEEVKESGIAA